MSVLSGGERRRVELARILFAGSDVLLLDEPTNHLDADAKSWLMKFLRGYRGALLVISHDLDLLDEAITRVLHLDRAAEEATGHLVEYKGTYSQYLAARAKDEVRLAKLASEQQAEVVRLQTRADQFRAGTKARMAQSMDKRIARLKGAMVDAPKGQRALRVHFPEPPHCGRVVLEVAGLAKSYGGPAVFEDVGFDVGRGERLLVLGLNGAGKTSLLRILAGQSTQDAGEVSFGHDVVAGYYAQEHEGLDPHRNLLDHMREQAHLMPEATQRGLLGMFGLSGEKAFQESGTLVGRGEDEAGARAAGGRPSQPAAPRRADQQPRPAEPGSRRRRARRLAGSDGDRQPRRHVRGAPAARPGAADARRRPRLLERRPARPRRAGLTAGHGTRRGGRPRPAPRAGSD